jgi:hypothetical protein
MNSSSSNNRPLSQGNRPFWMPATALAPIILGFALILTAGCGPKAPALSSSDLKAFDSAPPEVKQTWEKALAADKANDYVTAQSLLDSLGKMQLSAEQSNAVVAESGTFSARLWQAAEKNDPAAVKAVQEINKSKDRRTTR